MNGPAAGVPGEAQSYVAAWLAREPGMELAQVFVPAAGRGVFALWGALLHQLDEAAFELSDANVARTKLAWWGEELAAMAGGQARHPLARALASHAELRAVPAPDWHALANAAIFAGGGENAPADLEALLAQGAPYARITARIEAAVFARGASRPPTVSGRDASRGPTASARDAAREPTASARDASREPTASARDASREPTVSVREDGAAAAAGLASGTVVEGTASAAGAIGVHHVLRRLEHSLGRDATQFPWPLNLRARHQAAPADFAGWRTHAAARAVVRDVADALARRVADPFAASVDERAAGARGAPGNPASPPAIRRAQAALDARRLRHLAGGGEKPLRAAGPATLWALWRAARKG